MLVTHPAAAASNWIRVPQAVLLPPASFGFRLATDTLALGYGRRLPAPVPDFHRIDDAHAGRTTRKADGASSGAPAYPIIIYFKVAYQSLISFEAASPPAAMNFAWKSARLSIDSAPAISLTV